MAVNEGEYITSIELSELHERASVVWFNSMFFFLKAHKGYRKGNIHLLLGSSGGGKSTLVRSMLIDALPRVSKKILVWLSEETADDFKMEISKTGLIDHGRSLLDKMDIFSEQDSDIKNCDEMFFYLSELLSQNKYDMVFLDNITTSLIYMDRRPNEQASVSKELKKLCQKIDIPMILIAHTGAEISDTTPRTINPNDIRGSKTIINLSQFIYILQRFMNNEKIFQTLRIAKHRGQDVKNKIFKLKFESRNFLFTEDRIINFDAFSDAFKERDKLR